MSNLNLKKENFYKKSFQKSNCCLNKQLKKYSHKNQNKQPLK